MRWEDIKDDIVQDSIVCYKAMDGIFNEPKDMYININYNCLRANSIRMGGDGFSSEFKSGKVVAINRAINVDTKAIYKTEAEAFHSNSECEGPCAWRSNFEYRYITEDQLDACGAIAAQETL